MNHLENLKKITLRESVVLIDPEEINEFKDKIAKL